MRTFGSILIVTLLAVSCGGGADDSSTTTTATAGGPGTAVGPTTSSTASSACAEFAEEYVEAARTLFASEPPTDALVQRTRSHLHDIDAAAGARQCGDTYRVAVCDGLDELTRAGMLVVYQMLTASCI